MKRDSDIILAVKCPPEDHFLSHACSAGITAVELYTSADMLHDIGGIADICSRYPLRYAFHAPNTGVDAGKLAAFADAINAEVAVTHDIYFEDEWKEIVRLFKTTKTRLCVENTYSIHEPTKFMRRYGLGRCLDLEHLQMECAGEFEEEFVRFIKQADHIHLTGYSYGSQLWHTHIHHSPEQGRHFLDLLRNAGYTGFVVSEAKASFQTEDEFRALKSFFDQWREGGQ